MPEWKIVSHENDCKSNEKKVPIQEMVGMFLPENPQRRINDLIISDSVWRQIETALNRIRFHEVLYEQWNLKSIDPHGRKVAINLYGPPGTGKTFCAEAIAHELESTIIKVSYAEIESKYVGDTSKAIKAAFIKAHQTNSVLFFDEADSILGRRLTNVTQSADHGVNVSRSTMLLELDNFDGIVLFATNLPKNFDSAFVRRIMAHIKFDMPDYECRTRLWRYLLPQEVPRENTVTAEWLSDQSDGLAGGDILNAVKISASQAVARKGLQRKIFQMDIKEALLQVRRSKQNVGYDDEKNRIIERTEENIAPEKLPIDVRKKYDDVAEDIGLSDALGS